MEQKAKGSDTWFQALMCVALMSILYSVGTSNPVSKDLPMHPQVSLIGELASDQVNTIPYAPITIA